MKYTAQGSASTLHFVAIYPPGTLTECRRHRGRKSFVVAKSQVVAGDEKDSAP